MSVLTKEKELSKTILVSGLMEKAERKTRERERERERKLNKKVSDASEKLVELEELAETMGLGVHKKRQRSNIKHVQLIQENLDWAFKNDLLTDAEQHFLFRISPLVEFGSNVICKKTTEKKYIPWSIKAF